MYKILAGVCLACVVVFPASARDTFTRIFDPDFSTLKVMVDGDFMSPPVIDIGSDRQIIISFDERADDRSYLRYRLVHCNADWQPSRLIDSEILDGFNYAEVEDFGFSANTFIHYVNYHIHIPSEGMTPLVSGNYLVEVYREDEPEQTMLQARLSIVEPRVAVSGELSVSTGRGTMDRWQQLSLTVDLSEYLRDNRVANPLTDIIVTVERNGDPLSSVTLAPPLRQSGSQLIYDHQSSLIFPAGNEFRRFETVNVLSPGMGVDSMRFGNGMYHAWLIPDEPHADRQYFYDSTQHGRFMVRELNATDSELGADYVMTHFTLLQPEYLDGDVYVQGEMNGYLPAAAWRMTYNPAVGGYTLAVPLKQGSYNYRYAVAPKEVSEVEPAGLTPALIPDPSPVEGDKYQTQNEYLVRVWHRDPMAHADRLIGTAVIQ